MLDSSTVDRVRDLAAKVVGSKLFELVHVEIAGTKRDAVVRIFIDKPDGITLDDCSTVSGELGEMLDAEDLIPGRYVLEVSSPGIERELYSIGDMKRFTGRLIKAKMRNAYIGQKTFVGELTGVDGDEFTMDDRTIGEITLPFRDVQKANLKIDLQEEFKRR